MLSTPAPDPDASTVPGDAGDEAEAPDAPSTIELDDPDLQWTDDEPAPDLEEVDERDQSSSE